MISQPLDSNSDQPDQDNSPLNELEKHGDYLPARMINEFAYCPRLFYFEHIEGLFVHNADTIEGNIRHKRVDKKTSALPAGKKKNSAKSTGTLFDMQEPVTETVELEEDQDPKHIHATSVTLASDHYGIISKIDLIEVEGNVANPVEYKRGKPKKGYDGHLTAWEPEQVQLCVQALVLMDHGYTVTGGTIFFWETRQRVVIPITPELIAKTEQKIQGARNLIANPQMPPPLDASPKCPRCSLVTICLPDETNVCRQIDVDGDPIVQPLLFDIGATWSSLAAADHPPEEVRQLITARDHRKPLYLNQPGLSVGKSGQVLQVKDRGKVIQTARLKETSQVNLMGAIQVSTQAIHTLMQLEIPLLYFSGGGWFKGMTQPVGLKNIMWRIEQFRHADIPSFCVSLASELVSAKIRNQRTLLMRNHVQPPTKAIQFLKSLQHKVRSAKRLDTLLGVEGIAARTYFEHFAGMIKRKPEADPLADAPWGAPSPKESDQTKVSRGRWLTFDFMGRNRRPPRDPVNALLSLGYSLLAKDLTVICAGVGLDPYLGFYHQPRYGRAALALDLMEPFRPLIVDSAVLSAINNRIVDPSDFILAGHSVALTANGRKGFIRAYEQRMDQLVTHPLFGYRVSYRRVLEIQTRLLARLLMGEIRCYPGFVTR